MQLWANTNSPVFDELRWILLTTFGPKAVLQTQLRGLRGVDRALIFGSWPRRYDGEASRFRQNSTLIFGDGDVNQILAESGRPPARWERGERHGAGDERVALEGNRIRHASEVGAPD